MRFPKALVFFIGLAAAGVPLVAQAQLSGMSREKQLEMLDKFIAERKGLLDGSYVFVGYASEGSYEVILPREMFVEQITMMVLTGDLPPEQAAAFTTKTLAASKQMGIAHTRNIERAEARRAEIEGAQTPGEQPHVQASAPAQPNLIERARAANGSPPGAVRAGAMPWTARAAAPNAPAPVDGSIQVPLVPVTPTEHHGFTPSPFTDWMTGTFDTGGGVMELTPAGGKYEYANGRLAVDNVDGSVMEGVWTQDSSGQQCKDGGYHGRFRLTFTETGFTGLFGYCDEEPAAQGGFYGTRRR